VVACGYSVLQVDAGHKDKEAGTPVATSSVIAAGRDVMALLLDAMCCEHTERSGRSASRRAGGQVSSQGVRHRRSSWSVLHDSNILTPYMFETIHSHSAHLRCLLWARWWQTSSGCAAPQLHHVPRVHQGA